MTLEYLETLLSRAKELEFAEDGKAEDVKIKSVEAVKRLFPEDQSVCKTLSELNFRGLPMGKHTYLGASSEQWRIATSELISILESRIDILKHHPNESLKPKSGGLTITDYTKPLEEKLLLMEDQNAKLRKKIDHFPPPKVTKFDYWVWTKKAFSWGIVSGFVGGAFVFGLYVGSSKFDNEKNSLYETNQRNKEIIDSLRALTKQHHLNTK